MEGRQLESKLKEIFGFDKFKSFQKEVITHLLNKENCFVIMPTGGGKSICYQLPALASKGMAIVISPLIALMKNQVDVLRGLYTEQAVAHVLNSSLSKSAIKQVKDDILEGKTKILYVAPESLSKQDNIDFLKQVDISFLAIDEAHCISEWGHDFRPDYRNIRPVLDQIKKQIPIIALTATATPKVQEDILKTLKIKTAKVFKASFNRPNLYYEVAQKTNQVDTDIIKFIKKRTNKSGIIYCMSRKKVEELTETLCVNGIDAVPYHAGLDSKVRAKNQDMFLMEQCHVVVATIAFGMGIDKPDVRYVIHYTIPKSLESYYQETGRAGRDGREGHCLAFYSYKDVEKMEKLISKKNIAEREVGLTLFNEMITYCETSISRRKFLLHYFGEKFDEVNGEGANMDDNTKYPKEKIEAKEDVFKLLSVVKKIEEKYRDKEIINVVVGETNALISSHKLESQDFFGSGKDKDKNFWLALMRQLIVLGYLKKEIETYGMIKITEKGLDYIKNPVSFMMIKESSLIDGVSKNKNNIPAINASSSTNPLMKILLDIRKKIAKSKQIPPYTIFEEHSIEEMTIKYPITEKELTNIIGVGEGKAKKFGKEFLESIKKFVEENSIMRPDDLIVKSTGQNSLLKLFLIQSIDRKLSLDDVANSKGLEMIELIKELETIISSGTSLDISYFIDEILDEYEQEELHEYFIETVSDDIPKAISDLAADYEEDEVRLYRIKFLNDITN